ncbi:hypothetical protein AB1K09_19965 [Solibacillus silvestris]
MERKANGQFSKGNGLKDLTGNRFGRLMVIGLSERKVGRKSYWNCKCDCGTIKEIRGDVLTSKREPRTLSCGCLRNEQAVKNIEKNHKHKSSGTRLYHIWQNMKARCYNANDNSYGNYGGRGIEICDEWLNDFAKFKEWALNNGYKESLSIERHNVNGNYEPSNCSWIELNEQANNRRSTKWVHYEGKDISLKELSELTNINYGTLARRYKTYKDNIEELTKPLAFEVSPKRNGNSNLTEQQVIEIKQLINQSDLKLTEIAALYNVSKSCISDIKKGKTWTSIN